MVERNGSGASSVKNIYTIRQTLSGHTAPVTACKSHHSAGGICITMRAVAGPEISPPNCLPTRYLYRFRPQNGGIYRETMDIVKAPSQASRAFLFVRRFLPREEPRDKLV